MCVCVCVCVCRYVCEYACMAHVCMYVGKGRVIKFVSFQLHVYKLIYYMYLSCTKYRLDTEVEVSQENRY